VGRRLRTLVHPGAQAAVFFLSKYGGKRNFSSELEIEFGQIAVKVGLADVLPRLRQI
jgi:hypothetical protein